MASTPKPTKKSRPASLKKSSKKKDVELKDEELEAATGGVTYTMTDVQISKNTWGSGGGGGGGTP